MSILNIIIINAFDVISFITYDYKTDDVRSRNKWWVKLISLHFPSEI